MAEDASSIRPLSDDLTDERYRDLFSTMVEGFAYHQIITDKKGAPIDYVFLEANDSFEAMTGLKRDDVIGRKVTEVLPGIEADPADWIGRYGRVALGGEALDFEQFAEPLQKWYSVRAYCPNPGFFVTLVNDITERKQAEATLRQSDANFRSLVENSSSSFLIMRDRQVVYANRRFSDMLGYDASDIVGSLRRFTSRNPNEIARLKDVHRRRRAGDPTVSTYETMYVSKDGTEIPVEVSRNRTKWENEDVWLLLVKDISDSKRLEEERQKSAKLESLGILAGGIAHDFNNLLTGIMGNASLARMKTVDQEVGQLLDQIVQVSKSAAGLTQQLLTFSKGGVPVRRVQPVGGLIKDIASFSLRGTKVSMDCRIPEDLWQADIDEGQIRQVINNLVINADQAMPRGGRINVTSENVVLKRGEVADLPQGSYIRIAVQDSGTGMSPEIMDKAFDPYFTTKPEGSGLGLATSYAIIRKHGGHITVDSVMGQGTTVTLYLPAVKRKVAKITTPKEQARMGLGRILVMDDESYILEMLQHGLTGMGYEVTLSRDGAAAVNEYVSAMQQGQPYDVVIMDLTIPGAMGGREAIKKLLRADPGVKAIVASGYSNDPVMAAPEEHGFKGVLAKPFTLDSISRMVNQVMGQK